MSNPPKDGHAPGSMPDPEGLSDQGLLHLHDNIRFEKDEPREGFSLMPIFLIFVFAGLIFWSGLYSINHVGGFRGDIFDDTWKPGPPGAVKPEDPIKHGAKIFATYCAPCHQIDGKGTPGTYPPLALSPIIAGTEDRAISIVYAGLSGPLTILGGTYNGAMPPIAANNHLKPKDVAALLSYVRQAFGNTDGPVDEDHVADVLQAMGDRGGWSPDELLKKFPLGMVSKKPEAAPAPAGGATPAAAPAGTAPAAGAGAATGVGAAATTPVPATGAAAQ